MHQKAGFLFGHQDGVETLELGYTGGHLAMDVLLPDQPDGLGSVEGQLTPAHLAHVPAELSQQLVDLTLPQFQVTESFSLKDALSSLGMPTAFSKAADFSGTNAGLERLKIDAVVHKS
jgi:serpin B